MSTVYLGIGSNVNAQRNIAAGLSALRERFSNVDVSPVYRSVAVGFSGDDFINLVARVETGMQPLAIKEFLNELEDRHGRRRDLPKFSDRTLDIDILLYDDLHMHAPSLIIPRPEIVEYAHVLKPLADLAPTLVHPVEHMTMAALWARFRGDRDGLSAMDPALD